MRLESRRGHRRQLLLRRLFQKKRSFNYASKRLRRSWRMIRKRNAPRSSASCSTSTSFSTASSTRRNTTRKKQTFRLV
eukprot:10570_5